MQTKEADLWFFYISLFLVVSAILSIWFAQLISWKNNGYGPNKAFIEAGASDETATAAADDVIQISQLPQFATKADIANLETRLLKWMIGCGFLFAGIVITGVGVLIQVMLSSGMPQ